MKDIRWIMCTLLCVTSISLFGDDNQTATVSPISSQKHVPFDVQIQLADFSLPNGVQSYAWGTYEGKWLLITGRTNGLHSFENNDDNFPPQMQNKAVFVVDPI